jgi:hypothetical protein
MTVAMLEGIRSSRLRTAVTALFALVVIAVGFLHVPQSRASAEEIRYRATLAFAAEALPAGDYLFLCEQDGGTGRGVTPRVCDACVLTTAPGLAVVASEAPDLPPPMRAVLEIGVLAEAAPSPVVVPSSRGPPSMPRTV